MLEKTVCSKKNVLLKLKCNILTVQFKVSCNLKRACEDGLLHLKNGDVAVVTNKFFNAMFNSS